MLSLKNPTIYIRVGIYITVYCNPFLIFLIIVALSLIHLPHGSQKVKNSSRVLDLAVGGPSPPPRSRCTQDGVQPASLALGRQEGRPCIAPPQSPPSIYTPWAPAPWPAGCSLNFLCLFWPLSCCVPISPWPTPSRQPHLNSNDTSSAGLPEHPI